jgi:proton-translocating NADH-quinone oxidoreductase chain N
MDSIILKSFIPEIFLSLAIFSQLIYNARLINTLEHNFPIIDKEVFNQTMFILFCVLILLFNLKIEGHFSNFLFLNDAGGRIAKILFVTTCLFTLPTILRSFIVQNLNFFEYFILLSLSIFSSLLLFSVFDLISGYLVIEMQALAFYVLASYKRDSAFSTEAGLKYFISGSFISGIFLLGCSLVYGSMGTLNFNDLSLLLAFKLDSSLVYLNYILILGILLVVFTLLFKISAAPFHFWSPDVYDGSPLATTVVFSILPKIVIFTFLIRWISAISSIFFTIKYVFIFVALLSLIFGTFFAIRQKRVKRLIVFSSIVQVGFMVAALSEYSVDGFVSLYFFLLIYILSSILIWSNVVLLYDFRKSTNIFYSENVSSVFLSSIANMSKTNKL